MTHQPGVYVPLRALFLVSSADTIYYIERIGLQYWYR